MRTVVLLLVAALCIMPALGATLNTFYNCPGPVPTPDCDARAFIYGLGTNSVSVVAAAGGDNSNGSGGFGIVRSAGATVSLFAVTLGPLRPGWIAYRGAVNGDGSSGALSVFASGTAVFDSQQCSAGVPLSCSIGDLAAFLPVQLGAGGTVFFAAASATFHSDGGPFPQGAGIQGAVALTAFESDRTTPVLLYDRDTVASLPETDSGLLFAAGFACILLGLYHRRQQSQPHGHS